MSLSIFGGAGLSPAKVHVWTTATAGADSDDHLARYRRSVPADEAARSLRFVQPADQARFLLARLLARHALSRFASVAPIAWQFRFNDHGRPELASRPSAAPDLRFNISHTEGLVACAIAIGREVGVDVEHVGRPLHHDIAERFFSPQEVADLRGLPDEQQPLAFFDYWTLKEAYIKARGLGLALPLGQFTFVRRPGSAPTICFAPELHDDPAMWQFAQFWPTVEHRMAVAVRREGRDLPIDVAVVEARSLA